MKKCILSAITGALSMLVAIIIVANISAAHKQAPKEYEHIDYVSNIIQTLLMDHSVTRKNQYSGKLTITGHIHLKKPMYFDGSGSKGTALEYHKWMPLPKRGVICIDTGCSEGNCLTAMVIEANKYYLEWQ